MSSDAQFQRLYVYVLLQMLADLGLSVYVEDFEKPFLTATSEFYMVRSACCKSMSGLKLSRSAQCLSAFALWQGGGRVAEQSRWQNGTAQK